MQGVERDLDKSLQKGVDWLGTTVRISKYDHADKVIFVHFCGQNHCENPVGVGGLAQSLTALRSLAD